MILLKFFNRLGKILDVILYHITNVLMVVILIATITQVIYRYVLQTSIAWTEEAARYGMLMMVFLGASLGVSKQTHIRLDVMDYVIKKDSPMRKILDALIMIVMLFVISVFTYWSWDFFYYAFEGGQKTVGMGLPYWIPYSTVLIGFVISIIQILRNLFNLFAGTDASPENDKKEDEQS